MLFPPYLKVPLPPFLSENCKLPFLSLLKKSHPLIKIGVKTMGSVTQPCYEAPGGHWVKLDNF